jgi:molybdopterin-guanine dinucleotide biosynthesis protein A
VRPAAFEVVVPVCDGREQLLCALYATALGARAEARLARAELRLGGLLEEARVRRVTSAELLADAELARVDPALRCLLGINTDADYRAALAMLDSQPQSGCAPR